MFPFQFSLQQQVCSLGCRCFSRLTIIKSKRSSLMSAPPNMAFPHPGHPNSFHAIRKLLKKFTFWAQTLSFLILHSRQGLNLWSFAFFEFWRTFLNYVDLFFDFWWILLKLNYIWWNSVYLAELYWILLIFLNFADKCMILLKHAWFYWTIMKFAE